MGPASLSEGGHTTEELWAVTQLEFSVKVLGYGLVLAQHVQSHYWEKNTQTTHISETIHIPKKQV